MLQRLSVARWTFKGCKIKWTSIALSSPIIFIAISIIFIVIACHNPYPFGVDPIKNIYSNDEKGKTIEVGFLWPKQASLLSMKIKWFCYNNWSHCMIGKSTQLMHMCACCFFSCAYSRRHGQVITKFLQLTNEVVITPQPS